MSRYLLILAGLLLTSCAHHRDVRPGEDGLHRVILQEEDANNGYRNASTQAEHYCSQFNKTAFVVNENSKYTGTMAEGDYHAAKTATKVAQVAGGALSVFGGQTERTAGNVALLGGSVGRGIIGNGYTYELKFRCK
ncbi:MAG: hypothetical protein ACXVCP_08085 [Bdellovibrio sp.]